MERLKASIPNSLKQTIYDATIDQLPLSSSSFLDYLLHFPPFRQMVDDLTARPEGGLCEKSKDEALRFKANANRLFSAGDYSRALSFYSQALRVAPMDADECGRNLVATLYVNRAFVFLKMSLLSECVRDCNRAIQISPTYVKAWYRRGMANASLKNYNEAINDLNLAMTVELSTKGKAQIEKELNTVLDQASGTLTPPIEQSVKNSDTSDEQPQRKLQCVNTPDKARGVASTSNILPASLVHTEEPLGAIILKSYRDTHCHYCFNELPVDKVPCISCSIPFYCSGKCQLRARGTSFVYPKNHCIKEKLPSVLENYVSEIISGADSETVTEYLPEHKHECQSGSWPLVLPSEIVLAGRIVMKMGRTGSPENADLAEILELAHHYPLMSSETKLELHIYSVVLLCCLERCGGLKIQINGILVSQVIILVSQIRVNSMSIVRIKSMDVGLVHEQAKPSLRAMTSNVEQVKVGQAIYKTGSLFNHSCRPNVHAYFLSRTLFIRTTEFVEAECPLELSYGPQVGEWDCNDRTKSLEDEYSFMCRCDGCSKINLSDLVLKAFHCVKPECLGVVLDCAVVDHEKKKIKHFTNGLNKIGSSKHDGINEVAENASLSDINPGYCMKCGSYRDLESSTASLDKSWKGIRRLEAAIVSEEISSARLSDALRSLDTLKSTLHPYNRSIAMVEDTIAEAFSLVGELQSARDHCKASIEILEKLYTSNHIAIGHELVKLASIQLPLGDPNAVEANNRLDKIFSCYYGSHADIVFPLLKLLRK